MFKHGVLFAASLLIVLTAIAQERENNWLAFPLGFRTPETGIGLGAAGAYSFYMNAHDTVSPASLVQAGFAVTENRQFLMYMPFQLFWNERKWMLHGQVEVYDFNFLFFGIGDALSDGEPYNFRFDRFRINALRRLVGDLYVGPRLWVENWRFSGFAEGGLLASNGVPGSQGGLTFDPGVVVFVDGRDNVFFPRNGHLVELVTQHAFGDFQFSRYRMDVRLYRELREGLVWANQGFVDHTTGAVPFYMMAQLGGSSRMRGYYEGRFRDRSAVLYQTELRLKLYRRWGMNGFWSLGGVAPSFDRLVDVRFQHAGGLGIRFTADRKKQLNLRLDAAFGRASSGLYFTVGEAF